MNKLYRFPAIFLFLFFCFFLTDAFSQVSLALVHLQDSLKKISTHLDKEKTDSTRSILNIQFFRTLQTAISTSGSFEFPFDSLKNLVKITSPDKVFRIYCWNLPKKDGSNQYFGFLQTHLPGKAEEIFILTDRSDSISHPESIVVDPSSWYGALYYKIIPVQTGNQTYYTLLAWDGYNSLITQKIIEILFFDLSGHPRFGAKMFRNTGNDEACRIFFRYSSSASMVLRYEEQLLPSDRKWNRSRQKFDETRSKSEMIVCDELVPLDPQMEGQYEFYIPSSEVFNGFLFKGGFWYFIKNVDARNPKQ